MSEGFFKHIKFDAKTNSKVSIETVQDLTYYSVFNGTKSNPFSFGDTGSNVKKIYQGYAEKETSRFLGKFGKTPEEFLKETKIAQLIYDGQRDFLESMEKADVEFKKATISTKPMSGKELKELIKNKESAEKELEKAFATLKKWEQATQKYLDVMSTVDATYAKGHRSGYEVKHSKSPSGQPIESLRLDSKAFTSYESARIMVSEMEKIMTQMGQNIHQIPDLKLVRYKVSKGEFAKTPKGNKMQETLKIEDLSRKMEGFINSIKGTIFEIAAASALEQAVGQIFSEIQMMGNEKGVSVKDSGVQFKTSKTDVKATTMSGLNVNLSMKNQAYREMGGRGTSAMASTLYNMIRITAQTDIETMQLASVFYTNPEMRKTNSSLNRFLAALVADMAVGSGSGDRIDFMVYKDTIVPMSTYLANLDKKISMTIGNNMKSGDIYDVIRGVKNISELNAPVYVQVLPK